MPREPEWAWTAWNGYGLQATGEAKDMDRAYRQALDALIRMGEFSPSSIASRGSGADG